MAAVTAVVTTVVIGAAITGAVLSIIQLFSPPKPATISFGFSDHGPRYGTFGPLDNTVSNELAVPVLYGVLKLAGNVIWQTDPGQTVSRIVGLCEGEISSIIDVRANDVPINSTKTPNSNFTTYVGTGTQKADSRVPEAIRQDMELHHLAYAALTLTASEGLNGGNPTITSIVAGVLVKTWNGAAWTSAKSFSRNPVACVRDFLASSRYGLGIPEANLDDASFGSAYEYCEELVGPSEKYAVDANTVFLLRSDGPEGTSFSDSSATGAAITASGEVRVSAAQSMLSGFAVFLDGLGDQLSVADNAAWDFGTGDFTIDFLVKFASVETFPQTFFSRNNFSEMRLQMDDANNIVLFLMGSQIISRAFTPQSFKRYHIAVVRSGTTLRLFINGVQQGDSVTDSTNIAGTSPIIIGQAADINTMHGWIGEFRISNTARWTADFKTAQPDEPRYRLDYILDNQRPAQDVLNDMLATFSGFLVYSGNKVKLRVERAESVTQYFGDGSTTKANAAFDPGNIVKDSFGWNMSSIDDRPNRIRIQWVDPDQNYVKVYTQVEDRIDQDERNTVITKDVALLGITRQSQASRMAKFYMSIAKYAHLSVSFSARLESVHCEVGDIVAVTHQSARFTRKLFRITAMQEAEDETIRFTCREYNASIYDDHQATAIVAYDQPSGPNLYSALSDVTGLSLLEDNYKNKDGVFVTNILVTWTAIAADQLLRLDRHLIQLSSDGGATYRDVAFASTQRTSYRIVLGNVQTGTTFTVRVKTISDRGAESGGATASVTIQGKRTPPADVEDFDATFAFDHIALSWSAINDEDLFGYEIRVGDANSTWETAVIITTENLGTRYDYFNFTRGTKKFFIKAIDNSGNYSENAATDSVTITTIPDSNVVFSFDLFSRITVFPHPLQGTLSSELDRIPTNDFDSRYNRIALGPKTARTFLDVQNDFATNLAFQQSGFVWGREDYVTTEETYETEAIDIGSVTTGAYILDVQTFTTSNLGFVSAQIATSTDGVSFTAFATFTSGQYSARYVKFKFLVQATNAPTKVRLVAAVLTVDVPDINQSLLNQSVSAGGRTFYITGFTSVKSIVLTTVGSSNLIPRITSQAALPNSFDVGLFDTSNVGQAGNLNVYISGY